MRTTRAQRSVVFSGASQCLLVRDGTLFDFHRRHTSRVNAKTKGPRALLGSASALTAATYNFEARSSVYKDLRRNNDVAYRLW
jgi:hypothetical protein